MVESIPREETVHQLAEHLVAEIEQVVHLDLRRKEEPKPAVKKMDFEAPAGKGVGKGKDDSGGSPKKDEQCRFFLTDGGCKKGRLCSWRHTLDDQRRCWTCGAKEHMANVCPRPDGRTEDYSKKEAKGYGKGKEAKGVSKIQKKEEAKGDGSAMDGEKSSEGGSDAEVMRGLLEEANKMLKGLSTKPAESDRLELMQKQLDELKKMKVLRLTRLSTGPAQGLLDSGATNPLRGRTAKDDMSKLEDVWVTLATGARVPMKITKSGVMVSEDEMVEPIVPLGMVGGPLGYEVVFKNGGCQITHPRKGKVPVQMRNGCPQISKEAALRIIEEIETSGAEMRKINKEEVDAEKRWIEEFVEAHPVLPEPLKTSLKETPSEDLRGLPDCNRRRRKLLNEGFVVYLYAGEKEGYWLGRAVKEVGRDPRKLVEVDILRDRDGEGHHDMMKKDGVYSTLLRAALDGKILGVITSPNCRSRCVLRHYPLPGGFPRPIRSWKEPWGKSDLTQDEKKVVREDDTLMWRSLMVYMVSFEMRKLLPGRSGNCEVKLGLEQPADPSHYMPEVVSFWKTEEWRRMKRHYGLQEHTFNQSAWGGKAVKPTTFGGNLLLNLPEDVGEMVGKEEVSSSKELARWAPGMVKEVAVQLQKQVWGREVKLKPLSWEEHVQRGHTPFRRDCQICQEAAARGRMHKKTSHPRAGILSLDVSGPYVRGNDLESEAKFMLVGAFTALRSRSGGEKVEVSEEVEAGPEMEIQEDEIEEGREVPEVRLEAAEVEGVEEDWEMVGCEEELVEVEDEKKKVEERQDPEIETLKLGVPLTGKTKEEVLSGIIDLYLKLRMDGYMVHTIHTDQGREFVNRDSKSWMRSRGIIHSTNSGEDPKANGAPREWLVR